MTTFWLKTHLCKYLLIKKVFVWIPFDKRHICVKFFWLKEYLCEYLFADCERRANQPLLSIHQPWSIVINIYWDFWHFLFPIQIFRVYLKSCRWLAFRTQPFNIYLKVRKSLIEILTHFTLSFDKSKLLQVENLHIWIVIFEHRKHVDKFAFTKLHLEIARGWQVWIWGTRMSCFLWNWDLQIGWHFLSDLDGSKFSWLLG